MFNIFKRKKRSDDGQQMGMLQRLAMKRLQNMSNEEREKVMQDALKPENRDKLMKAMEKMQASGQISKHQIEMAKKKLGL